MTSRSLNHVRTLRQILDYNDNKNEKFSQISSIQGNSLKPNSDYSLKISSLLEVSNWNVLVSNRRVLLSLIFYVIFLISQLILSYTGFICLDLEDKPLIFTICQVYNLISSYFFPLLIATSVDDNLNNPFENLTREVQVYRRFKASAIVQAIGIFFSSWSTIVIFNREHFYLVDYEFRNKTKTDITQFTRWFQLISLQLSICNFLTSAVNLLVTSSRLFAYFNRIERNQSLDDLQAVFSNVQIDDNMYDERLKTFTYNHY